MAKCEQILHQLHAVQAAIQSASCLILIQQVEHCLDVLQQNPSPDNSSIEIKRLVDLYKYSLIFSSIDVHREIEEVKT